MRGLGHGVQARLHDGPAAHSADTVSALVQAFERSFEFDEAGGFALDFGAIGYLYVGEPDGADYNYAEFKAAASRAVEWCVSRARSSSSSRNVAS